MSARRLKHAALLVAAVCVLAPATAGGARQAAQGCSKDAVFAAAVQAGIANAPDQVAGGVCGAFLGPGSQAIAVTRRGQQCDPNLIWAVLRFSGGAWQQAPGPWDDGGPILGVTAVGDDLREEQPIFRASDRGCDPTGGSRARIWHWDGTRLAPGRSRGPRAPIRGHSRSPSSPTMSPPPAPCTTTATGGRCPAPTAGPGRSA